MANATQMVPDMSWNICSIVKCADQNYAEVQTNFVERNRRGIYGIWKIKKFDDGYHKLQFNNQYDNPMILIQGWNKFKDFHNLPANVEVQLMFQENNEFEVHAIKELNDPAEYPAFHSRSVHPTRTAIFHVELTDIDVNVNQFLPPDDLAHFLQDNNIHRLALCGPNGVSRFVHVLNLSSFNEIQLGSNWKDVCEAMNFKPGNTIRFKFEKHDAYVSQRCHVMKLA